MMSLSKLLGLTVAIGIASGVYMYLCVRLKLRKSNEHIEKHFPFHRSEIAWTSAYMNFARANNLPIWPVYARWFALIGTVILLLAFLYRG